MRHTMPFEPVSSQVSFPDIEERVLRRWREADVFHRSLRQREGEPEFVFYEGPPTANGRPGVHHVLPRVFKDIYPRYQTMRGKYVPRKGGWDCHGLPVELEIERELGLSSKREIEAFGIEAFNAKCRESVLRYVSDFEELTERIAFWVDLDEAYKTMTNDYIESVWWSLKRIYEDGLLYEDFKVVPYCPRCGTPLSDHEVALGYTTVTDPSVYVRFPLKDAPNTSLLVWTTTPWTLLSNAAAAINPEVTYVAVENDGERLIMAEPLVHRVMGPDAKIVEWFDAGSLEGREYEPPYHFVEPKERAWFVVTAEYVTTEDGTGVVHTAPAYGAEDLDVGRANGLPVIHLVNEEGKFEERAGAFAGKDAKRADPEIIEDLRTRGLLFRSESFEHTYPLCWRCGTPLLYYARTSWYIRTTARKDDLLRSNEDVTWHPDHIKHGRFGDWLANNIDWSLSRNRYWGTPLPVWRCGEGHASCIGSVAELSERAGRDLSALDLHRPFVDDITFACAECGGTMQRVREVIDAWYDSGAMPFAQWHYPFDNEKVFESRFPADYICEAIDQTRGWFYSLLAEGTLLFGKSAYDRVVCLGHIVDKDGRKMSKSLGNVINPWDILNKQGADALRWYFFTVGSPWSSRRVYFEAIDDVVRGFMRMLWNVYSFYVLYANSEGLDPATLRAPAVTERPDLDRWILAELHDGVRAVTDLMEAFDATAAGRRIEQLVDDLSNWYVRRSRRRFYTDDAGPSDKAAAHATLYEVLRTLSLLLAPFTPFLADELWRNLVASQDAAAADSVHLADWPRAENALIDESLRQEMAAVRQAVALGLRTREDAKIKVRQPLAKAVISGTNAGTVLRLKALVADELNVKDVAVDDVAGGDPTSASDGGMTVTLDTAITDELRAEGSARELIRAVQNLRRRSRLQVSDRIRVALDCPDPLWASLQPHLDWIAGEVLAVEIVRGTLEALDGTATVKIDGENVTITLTRA